MKQRLVRDIQQIQMHPLNEHGIYYKPDEENLFRGTAMLVGPEGTPYFGGYYFFLLEFPETYPYYPPTFTFLPGGSSHSLFRFHPHLYTDGKVCLSLLNTWRGDQWTACQTITSILLSLVTTLFTASPLQSEPGVTFLEEEISTYNECVTYVGIMETIMRVVTTASTLPSTPTLPPTQPTPILLFKNEIQETFQRNREALIQQVKEKKETFPQPFDLYVRFFGMRIVDINYSKLYEDLRSLCINKIE